MAGVVADIHIRRTASILDARRSDLEPPLAPQMKDGELTGPQLDPSDVRARALERLEYSETDPED